MNNENPIIKNRLDGVPLSKNKGDPGMNCTKCVIKIEIPSIKGYLEGLKLSTVIINPISIKGTNRAIINKTQPYFIQSYPTHTI